MRERLLGALVFLCLGLIFYPVVFDTRSDISIDRSTQIPAAGARVQLLDLGGSAGVADAISAPDADQIFVPAQQETDAVASSADEPPAEDQSPIVERTSSPILTDAGMPNAWVLQVGSFGQVANAEDLVNRLLDAGYRAYMRSVDSQGSRVHRVLVGPYLDRGIAEQDQRDLASSQGVNALLTDFSP